MKEYYSKDPGDILYSLNVVIPNESFPEKVNISSLLMKRGNKFYGVTFTTEISEEQVKSIEDAVSKGVLSLTPLKIA